MKIISFLGLLLPLINAGSSVTAGRYTYEVKVVYAKGLTDMDTDWLGWFGKKNYNDVYVDVIAFGDGDDKIKVSRTSMDEEAEEPRWEETFVFDGEKDGNGEYEKFLFKLYDSDAMWGDYWDLSEFLGETEFLYASAIVECDKIYSSDLAVKRDDKAYGTLFVEVTKSGCSGSVSYSTNSNNGNDNDSDDNNNNGNDNNNDDYNNNNNNNNGNDDDDEYEKFEEEKESFEEYEEEKKEEEEREEYEENKQEFEEYEEEKKGGGGGGKNK